jgi:hypothetical protein
VNKNGSITWRCENRNCNAKMKTNNDETVMQDGQHNHDATIGRVSVERTCAEIRKCVLISEDAPMRIVSRCLTNIDNAYANQFPKLSMITRSIRQIRHAMVDNNNM